MTVKGICTHQTGFCGWIKVSDKGQIAIPAELRRKFNINTGDKLLIMERKDQKGISLIKTDALADFVAKIREGE